MMMKSSSLFYFFYFERYWKEQAAEYEFQSRMIAAFEASIAKRDDHEATLIRERARGLDREQQRVGRVRSKYFDDFRESRDEEEIVQYRWGRPGQVRRLNYLERQRERIKQNKTALK